MRVLILAMSFVFLNLFCGKLLIGQSDLEKSKSIVSFKFFDVSTGKAVYPQNIGVVSPDDKVLDYQESYFNDNPQLKKISYSLSPNNYRLFIEEEGYESTDRRFSALTDGDYHIYLTPRVKDERLKSKNIESLLRENKTLIIGYVTDEGGVGIDNVDISFKNKIISTSDSNGYYEFYLDVETLAYKTYELSFSKSNFLTKQKAISNLWSRGSWSLSVQLLNAEKEEESIDSKTIEVRDLGLDKSLHFKLNRSTCILPTDIIVGNNCSGQSCSGPHISLALDDYVKNVLPNEWIPGWLNATAGLGGEQSLRAGVIAIRTYAAWWTFNPISANYDICNTTTCQVFVNGSTTPATDAVVDAMEGYYLLDASGNIMQTEFARETNNGSCGNGRFAHTRFGPPSNGGGCCGDGSGDVCFGAPFDAISHDRGMCQFGTIRWATGFTYPIGGGQGQAHNKGTKTWQEMAEYYYCNNFSINQCDTGCPTTLVLTTPITSGLYEASDNVQAIGVISSASNVTMTGGNFVEWSTGFDGRNGSVVIGEVSPCNN